MANNVEFRNVRKQFGAVTALHGLDLEIEPGEFVSLLGPSGSGKTTSLNMLAGLLPISGGEILIGGRCVNDVPPEKRDIAMVFQNYALYPHMSIEENLMFPLKARRRLPKAEMAAKVREISALLGIENLLDRYPKELSGGQQQRVSLGRALIRDPSVLLLDEPLSNLDARLRIKMRRDLKLLHERLGATIVYVTHDQAEALTLSSRVAVFDHGALQQFGTPDQIYNEPVNIFVANFLGEREVTFIDGDIVPDGGGMIFRAGDFEVPIDWEGAPRQEVSLGIRVETLKPVDPGSALLSGLIRDVEHSGADLILYVEVGTHELVVRSEANSGLRRNDPVHLGLAQARFLLFDTRSGVALHPGRSEEIHDAS